MLMVSNLRCYISRNRGVTTRYIMAGRTSDQRTTGLRTTGLRDHGPSLRIAQPIDFKRLNASDGIRNLPRPPKNRVADQEFGDGSRRLKHNKQKPNQDNEETPHDSQPSSRCLNGSASCLHSQRFDKRHLTGGSASVPISALRFGINGGPHRLAITGFTPIRLDLARFIGGGQQSGNILGHMVDLFGLFRA